MRSVVSMLLYDNFHLALFSSTYDRTLQGPPHYLYVPEDSVKLVEINGTIQFILTIQARVVLIDNLDMCLSLVIV